jgi:hypothetical protein
MLVALITMAHLIAPATLATLAMDSAALIMMNAISIPTTAMSTLHVLTTTDHSIVLVTSATVAMESPVLMMMNAT